MLSKNLKQIIQLLQQKKLSAVELCAQCQQRLDKVRQLNAYITETPDTAKLQAIEADKRLQAGQPLGPLDGIPIAIKDNFSTTGVRTSCASRMLADYVPPYTATVVSRLSQQGAAMLGKTNMDEFAMGCGSVDSVFGPVRNPWHYPFSTKEEEVDDWYIAGGSSGGSAVAVATGTAFAALGSDTGGSVRHPASMNGIVGLKPTYGTVSRHGLIPLVNSLDVPGVFARCVDDAAIVLNAIQGHDPLDSTTIRREKKPVHLDEEGSISGLHIGIPKEYYPPELSSEIYALWDRMAAMLEQAGCRVSEVSLPHTQYAISCYSVLCCCEVASNMARYDGIQFGHRAEDKLSTEDLYAATRHEGFNEVVRGRILAGNYFLLKKNYDHYFHQAMRVRRLISDDFENVFSGADDNSGVDLLLTPAVLSEAPKHGWFSKADNRTRTQEMDVFTQPANLAGIPAVTVPVGLSSSGLPLSLQLLAPRFHEHSMLNAAKWIETQVNFPTLNLDFLDD